MEINGIKMAASIAMTDSKVAGGDEKLASKTEVAISKY